MYKPEMLGYYNRILYQIKENDIILLEAYSANTSTIRMQYENGPKIKLVDMRFLKRLGLGDGNILS